MNVEEYLTQFYNLDEIELKILKLANETNTPILSISKAKILSLLVGLKNPKDCFEIGLGIGFSTYAILKSLDQNANLISIDKNFHRVDLFYNEIYKNFDDKIKKNLKVYPVDAFYCMEIFSNLGKKFDFIFIDSQKRDYYFFYEYLLKLSKKGSLIVIDNITYNFQTFKKVNGRSKKYLEGVKLVEKFILKIKQSSYFKEYFIPAGDGMCVLIRL